MSVSLWGSLLGVCLEFMTWLSIVASHGLQWDFCTCAQLLAGSRCVFLKIFVHGFLCSGLGSNILLGVVSFARDTISHLLPIPSVVLCTSPAATVSLSVTFLWLPQLYTLTSHYRLSTDRCGRETHREPTPPSMVALFPVRFLFFYGLLATVCSSKLESSQVFSPCLPNPATTMVRFG